MPPLSSCCYFADVQSVVPKLGNVHDMPDRIFGVLRVVNTGYAFSIISRGGTLGSRVGLLAEMRSGAFKITTLRNNIYKSSVPVLLKWAFSITVIFIFF